MQERRERTFLREGQTQTFEMICNISNNQTNTDPNHSGASPSIVVLMEILKSVIPSIHEDTMQSDIAKNCTGSIHWDVTLENKL